MKLGGVRILLLFPNLPPTKSQSVLGVSFFWDRSDLWIKLVPRTRSSQVLFWDRPGMLGLVNYLSVKWRLCLPTWAWARQIKALFLLSSGDEVERHGNTIATSLISQLLPKSLTSVIFAAVCILSFTSGHWLFPCFSPSQGYLLSKSRALILPFPLKLPFPQLVSHFLLGIQAVYLSASPSPHGSHYKQQCSLQTVRRAFFWHFSVLTVLNSLPRSLMSSLKEVND